MNELLSCAAKQLARNRSLIGPAVHLLRKIWVGLCLTDPVQGHQSLAVVRCCCSDITSREVLAQLASAQDVRVGCRLRRGPRCGGTRVTRLAAALRVHTQRSATDGCRVPVTEWATVWWSGAISQH